MATTVFTPDDLKVVGRMIVEYTKRATYLRRELWGMQEDETDERLERNLEDADAFVGDLVRLHDRLRARLDPTAVDDAVVVEAESGRAESYVEQDAAWIKMLRDQHDKQAA